MEFIGSRRVYYGVRGVHVLAQKFSIIKLSELQLPRPVDREG